MRARSIARGHSSNGDSNISPGGFPSAPHSSMPLKNGKRPKYFRRWRKKSSGALSGMAGTRWQVFEATGILDTAPG